jgi:hypothetical protein
MGKVAEKDKEQECGEQQFFQSRTYFHQIVVGSFIHEGFFLLILSSERARGNTLRGC